MTSRGIARQLIFFAFAATLLLASPAGANEAYDA